MHPHAQRLKHLPRDHAIDVVVFDDECRTFDRHFAIESTHRRVERDGMRFRRIDFECGGEPESRTMPWGTLDLDPRAHRLNDALADRQAQPGASSAPLVWSEDLVKGLKEPPDS